MNTQKGFSPISLVVVIVGVILVGSLIQNSFFSKNDSESKSMVSKVENSNQPSSAPSNKIDTSTLQVGIDSAQEIADAKNWFVTQSAAVCYAESLNDPACATLPVFEMRYPKHFTEAVKYLSSAVLTADHPFVVTDTSTNQTKFLVCSIADSMTSEIFDTEAQKVVIQGEEYCITKNVSPNKGISYRYIKKIGDYYPGFSINGIHYETNGDMIAAELKMRTFLDSVAATIKLVK